METARLQAGMGRNKIADTTASFNALCDSHPVGIARWSEISFRDLGATKTNERLSVRIGVTGCESGHSSPKRSTSRNASCVCVLIVSVTVRFPVQQG
jgi:hypothetical protein